MTDRRRLNRLITLSGLDEISRANMEIRGFIVHSSHPSSIHHTADKIFPAHSAAPPAQDDARCAVVGELAS
jgi:hypothetical protein